jgi:hypothetical protein
VRGGVLVEERAPERRATLPDERALVDERDLAEERRVLVDGQLGADSSAPVVAFTSVTRPLANAISRSRTTVPPSRTSGCVARTVPVRR